MYGGKRREVKQHCVAARPSSESCGAKLQTNSLWALPFDYYINFTVGRFYRER